MIEIKSEWIKLDSSQKRLKSAFTASTYCVTFRSVSYFFFVFALVLLSSSNVRAALS